MKYYISLLLFVLISCSTTKELASKDYLIKKYKISNRNYLPYLIISCYDYDTQGKRSPIPARIEINDIVFGARIEGDSIHDMIFRPRPNKIFDLDVNWLGKIPVEIKKLKVNIHDSIIVEINMKDANTILH
jgi:hypothetical protein